MTYLKECMRIVGISGLAGITLFLIGVVTYLGNFISVMVSFPENVSYEVRVNMMFIGVATTAVGLLLIIYTALKIRRVDSQKESRERPRA